MSERRNSDITSSLGAHSPVNILTHQGRRFRKSSTTSTLAPIKPVVIESGQTSFTPPITHLSQSPRMSSPRTSLTARSIILPPPQQPTMTVKGRPFSAKRSIKTKSLSGLQPSDEYRLQFALQHSKPLPPIDSNPETYHSKTQSLPLHYSPKSSNTLVEVDSAVDLDYASHCGTPTDSNCSYTISAVPLSNMLKKEQEAALLKEIMTLPPDEQSLSLTDKVALCLKLPNGERLHNDFLLINTLMDVIQFAEDHSGGVDLKGCEISTNEIPKKTFIDLNLTLKEAGITVRTVLHFSF